MRRIVIDVTAEDQRRRSRVLTTELNPSLRASTAEIALHRQMCRADRDRAGSNDRTARKSDDPEA